MKIIVASKNKDKIREINDIFKVPDLELVCLSDIQGVPDVEEDSFTFQGNAVKKALTIALCTHEWTLADDSGLEVEALDNAPGVRSARYAGEPVDHNANNLKLIDALKSSDNRKARFCCVIALCSPNGTAQTVEGECAGRIIDNPRGSEGFGYDPLFVPDGYDRTFAELSPDVKNRISHRAVALEKAKEKWGIVFENNAPEWPKKIF